MTRIIFLPFLAILSLIACCIEVDISVPGFPDMAAYFQVPDLLIQLTIAYNFLGFCLASLLHGPLSECYGRRRVMVIGNACLLIGATGCVISPTINWLLAARFLQGMGASTSAVVVFAMIADAYPKEKAVKLIGLMNAVFSTLMALAPVAGAFINQAVGWRGNYALVACICALSWLMLVLLLPETKQDRVVLVPRQILRDYGKLLTSTLFMSAAIVPSLLYAAYMSFVACASFLYMETFELSIMAYAMHQATIVATFSLTSILSGQLIQKWKERGCILRGILLCGISAGALGLQSVTTPHSPYLITLLMSLFCVGAALCYPVIFTASLEIFPQIKGTASSIIMSLRACLCSAFVGLTSTLYNGHPLAITFVIGLIFIVALPLTFCFLHWYWFKPSDPLLSPQDTIAQID